ncbi:MAG: SIS domain-containing protein [Chloroflexi bacterium]|nr:SIS domain-containing protein [Chloroflexota bacterium]
MTEFTPNIDWDDAVKRRVDTFSQILSDGVGRYVSAIESVVSTLESGGKLIFFGNGGSAAEAQHIAAEFVGHFVASRGPLPALALTTDASALTAIGNDYSFDEIYARQVKALAQPGDYVVGFTTSGSSKNVIRGLEEASSGGIANAAFVGRNPGLAGSAANEVFTVPSDETAVIQEVHLAIWHMICAEVDTRFA